MLAKIPIDPLTAEAVDAGRVEYLEAPWFDGAVDRIIKKLP